LTSPRVCSDGHPELPLLRLSAYCVDYATVEVACGDGDDTGSTNGTVTLCYAKWAGAIDAVANASSSSETAAANSTSSSYAFEPRCRLDVAVAAADLSAVALLCLGLGLVQLSERDALRRGRAASTAAVASARAAARRARRGGGAAASRRAAAEVPRDGVGDGAGRDLATRSADAFSLVVENPPARADDADEWMRFFSRYGDVRYISIARDNAPLLKACAVVL